jgi:hypothetical protein
VRGSALIVTVLMVAFSGALAYSAARGLDVQCGCFSTETAASGNMWGYLLRDLLLLAAALSILLQSMNRHASDKMTAAPAR